MHLLLLGVGAGYAYTYVYKRHFFLHGSVNANLPASTRQGNTPGTTIRSRPEVISWYKYGGFR
jgi:hypothetical protein